MRCVVKVSLRAVSVMRRRLVIAFFVVRRRLAMMTRRVLVMFRRFVMMFCRLLRHDASSFYRSAGRLGPARGSSVRPR
jgi:hypothetical protein